MSICQIGSHPFLLCSLLLLSALRRGGDGPVPADTHPTVGWI